MAMHNVITISQLNYQTLLDEEGCLKLGSTSSSFCGFALHKTLSINPHILMNFKAPAQGNEK